MLVKDFEFRIVPKPNEKGEYCNCNNADCPARKFHFLVGNEAKSRLSDENLQDCKIELWTGKVDKNGKKIFEGDIVTDGYFKYETKFKKGKFFLKCDNNKYPLYDKDEAKFTIIGNIHETEQH